MLAIDEIIHAGITVRGSSALSTERAKSAASDALDGWQKTREPELPPGASFKLLQEKVTPNGPEALVTRYLQVVAG